MHFCSDLRQGAASQLLQAMKPVSNILQVLGVLYFTNSQHFGLLCILQAWYWRAAARKLQGAHQLATADGEQALLLSTQLQITGSTQDVLLLMQQLKNLSCPDSVSPVVDSSAPEPASAVAAAPPAAKVCALDIPIIQRSGNIPHDQLSHGELQPANGPDISQLNHLLAAHLVPPGNDAGLQQCNGRQDGQHQHAVNTQNQQQQQQQQQQEQPAHQPASYASAQARICVAYSESQGRHVIAAANIPAAEDVVLELPVAAVPVKQARKTHCWRCYKRLGSAPFYCSGCQQVRLGHHATLHVWTVATLEAQQHLALLQVLISKQ